MRLRSWSGSLLVWASPVATLAWQVGPRAAFTQPQLAWFGYLHPLLMVIAVAILEAGHARARRADDACLSSARDVRSSSALT